MVVTSQNSSSREQRSTRSRLAFTLVELLVVIGIIALLISVLLPALNKARQSASQTKCMANLRTIGQAMGLYTNVYKGMLPFGFVDEGTQASPQPTYQGGYVGEREHWDTLLLRVMSARGVDAQYSKANTGQAGFRGVFTCPSVSIDSTVDGRVLHYSSHPVLFPNLIDNDNWRYMAVEGVQKKVRGYRFTKLKRTAEIVGIFDGVVGNGDFMANSTAYALHKGAIYGPPTGTYLVEDFSRRTGAPAVNAAQNLSTPVDMTPNVPSAIVNSDSGGNTGNIRFRHGSDNRANALMMDGHVESFSFDRKKAVAAATDMTLRNLLVAPNR